MSCDLYKYSDLGCICTTSVPHQMISVGSFPKTKGGFLSRLLVSQQDMIYPSKLFYEQDPRLNEMMQEHCHSLPTGRFQTNINVIPVQTNMGGGI